MIHIAEPFKTELDVTDDTPINEIPEGHGLIVKQRFMAEGKLARDLTAGLEKLSVNPDVEQVLMKEIHRTVSYHDDHVVRVAFAAGLSAFSKPLNLALKAESGSGKTYSTMETTSFLPDKNIETLNYVSPKVFVHENGIKKVDINGESVEFDTIPEPQKPDRSDQPDNSVFQQLTQDYYEEMKKYRELQSKVYFEIDLRNKVLIFMESIDQKLFTMLKTTMSRDNQEHGFNDSKYVDEKGRVHKTRFIGSPVMIFNSVDSGEYNNEFATRCLTATPNTSADKIRAAMEISARKAAYPFLYTNDRFEKRLLKEYFSKVRDTMQTGKISVVNPFPNIDKVFNTEQTRAMRDFNHFIELVAPFAMLHLFQRPVVVMQGKRFLVPTVQDVLDAKAAFDKIVETTQTNADARLMQFYWDCVADKANGTTAEDLTDEYNKGKKRKVSSRTIYYYLDTLVKLEWVDARKGEQVTGKGYVDTQKLTYHPLKNRVNNANMLFAQDLELKLKEDFGNWLKTCEEKGFLSTPFIIPKIDGSAYEITIDELKDVVLGSGNVNLPRVETDSISSQVLTAKIDSNDENNPLNDANKEFAQSTQLSTDDKTTYYRKLSPSELSKCDGEAVGEQCPHEAAYEMLIEENPVKPRYCESHFQTTRKSCIENGYKLTENHIVREASS